MVLLRPLFAYQVAEGRISAGDQAKISILMQRLIKKRDTTQGMDDMEEAIGFNVSIKPSGLIPTLLRRFYAVFLLPILHYRRPLHLTTTVFRIRPDNKHYLPLSTFLI